GDVGVHVGLAAPRAGDAGVELDPVIGPQVVNGRQAAQGLGALVVPAAGARRTPRRVGVCDVKAQLVQGEQRPARGLVDVQQELAVQPALDVDERYIAQQFGVGETAADLVE